VRSVLRTWGQISQELASWRKGTYLAGLEIDMSSPNRHEAAARHLPVAHQRSASKDKSGRHERYRASEPRLQVAVTRTAPRDERDPYADVPCTD
jgi:hypothetical protein